MERSREHIVDVLIAERAPRLSKTPAWPILRPALYQILGYRKARRFADQIRGLGGAETLAEVSKRLKIHTSVRGLHRLPREGRVVLVSNHPTSVTDGIAIYDAIYPVRPDLRFYINADSVRVAPRLSEVVIPIEWMPHKKTRDHTRETLRRTRDTMENEGALMIFPAGQLAERVKGGGFADTPWAPSAFAIARNYESPILPMHLSGPTSKLFHFFNRFSEELRDVTLFYEMLNKAGGRFDLTVGPLIAPGVLPSDAAESARLMKSYVEDGLARDPDLSFEAWMQQRAN
jgi:putative hemolysin